MKKEIERKFLVSADKLPPLPQGVPITQVYFSETPLVRVRIAGKKASIAVKAKLADNLSRHEYEYKIPLREAKELVGLTDLKIEKVRHRLPLNGLVWEIDFFKGKNKGLVLAEVELPKENHPVKLPLWVSREVTDETRFYNVRLAQKPFSTWNASDQLLF